MSPCAFFLLLYTFTLPTATAQTWYDGLWADPDEERKNVLDGNRIRTTMRNTGLLGRIGAEASFVWPAESGNEYAGDFTMCFGTSHFNPLLREEYNSVVVTKSPARGRDEVNPMNPTQYWTYFPLPGFAVEDSTRLALSDQPSTWPETWPDTNWNGSWNSLYGRDQFISGQEGLFWMDDSRDLEFLSEEPAYRDSVDHDLWLEYFPDDPFMEGVPKIRPVWSDPQHGGLGLKVMVRPLAWSHPVLEDVLFLLYDFHNAGELPLDKSVVGFLLGDMIGGENDTGDDVHGYSLDHNLVYAEDFDDNGQVGWVPVHPGVRNVGVLGIALVDSPGDARDWIDNDGDFGSTGTAQLEEALLETMLAPRTLEAGEVVVQIDYGNQQELPRSLVRVPLEGELGMGTRRGQDLAVYDGITVQEVPDNRIDDNFNGLIDEGPEDLDHGFVDWQLLGLPLPAPGESVLVTPGTLRAYDAMIDESRMDGLDNDGDWDLQDDLGKDGLPSTADEGEGDGVPTPGEPDFEWNDPDEDDQIGLTGVDLVTFAEYSARHDADLWDRMRPGQFDSDTAPANVDCYFSSGYFSLPPGARQRVVLAIAFGENTEDLISTVEQAQQFYNEDFHRLEVVPVPHRESVNKPKGFRLEAPAPNPFNPSTRIELRLSRPESLSLFVYNLQGRRVAVLHEGVLAAGRHSFHVDAGSWSSGLYLIEARGSSQVEVRKALLLR